MADDVDRAGVLEQQLRDDALQAHQRRAKKAVGAGVAAEICQECDEPIPAARRAAAPGCARCVECQARLERGGRA